MDNDNHHNFSHTFKEGANKKRKASIFIALL